MANVVFSLLRLPQKVQTEILNSLEAFEIMNFSLCTKRTKYLTTLLKRNLDAECHVYSNFTICLRMRLKTWVFQFPRGIGMKEFVEHILTVFYDMKINSLGFNQDCSLFQVDTAIEVLRGHSIETLSVNGTEEETKPEFERVLDEFHNTKVAHIDFKPNENANIIQRTLIRNYHLVTVDSFVPLNFNDILITNSRRISLFNSKLSSKSLNQFLKLWMRGSNPRLEHLHITSPALFNKENVFKGISSIRIAEDQQRVFRKSSKVLGEREEEVVIGGYDITRGDGTSATIVFGSYDGIPFAFDMYVWVI